MKILVPTCKTRTPMQRDYLYREKWDTIGSKQARQDKVRMDGLPVLGH
jgi:hypothetical protein